MAYEPRGEHGGGGGQDGAYLKVRGRSKCSAWPTLCRLLCCVNKSVFQAGEEVGLRVIQGPRKKQTWALVETSLGYQS